MEVTKRVACTLLVVLSVVCQLSSATVVVCDPSVGPQSVTVGLNDHVVYTSKNYPLAYPQGSCDVSFYPATSNTKLVLVFEYFRAGNDNDTLDFLANVTGSAPGSKPELQIVDTLAGDFWPTYYRYPENINEPTQNFPGIIQTRFTARSNLLAPGFIAHIISYDVSKPYECQSGTTVLQAGDSLLTVNTGAPFNDAAPATCDWSVKPADGSTLLRTIVNYVSQTNGQVLVSTNGQQTVNVSGSGSNSFQEPQLIFDNIANQIDFKFSKLGHNWEDGIFTYSIVVQAFSSANTPQSTCPDTGKTFDLVGDGSNAMTPSYIKTQTDFTKFYENNQRCTWAATITDPTKYAIVSYIHINQFEDCCDMFMTTTDNGQSWKKMIWNTDYPKQSQLMVKFESDSIRTELGGMFELRAVPLFDTFYAGGNSVMLPQNGVELNIKTPGYGFAIPRGIDLTYTFTSPSNPWVRFRLSNMYATNAIYQGNNFTIYDGTSTSSPVIGMINNEYMMENENDPNRAYKNFFSTQPHLTVRWQSSASYAVVSPSQVVGLQLSLAGVNNKVQVLPNFGNGDDGGQSSSSPVITTTTTTVKPPTTKSISQGGVPSMSPSSSQSTVSSATPSVSQSSISSGSATPSSSAVPTGSSTSPSSTSPSSISPSSTSPSSISPSSTSPSSDSPSSTSPSSTPLTSSASSIRINSFSSVLLFFSVCAFVAHLL